MSKTRKQTRTNPTAGIESAQSAISDGITLQMLGRLQDVLDVNTEAVALLKRLSSETENPKLASAMAATLDGRKTILRKLKASQ